jgi:hypothetical protein
MANTKLAAFLKPIESKDVREIAISERFVNEDGTIAKFAIRSIMQSENELLIKQATKVTRHNGVKNEDYDRKDYQRRLVVACVETPDFKSEEMCKAYGCIDPLDVPGEMLRAGEFNMLVAAIMEFNGFKDLDTLMDEAGNS